jgi:MoaA/NifB/PqqE/SkfB family radical SAM enzyme
MKIRKYLRTTFLKPHIILRHLKIRIAYWFCKYINGYAPLPLAFHIAVNNRCNLHCKMCDIGQNQSDTFFYKNAGISNSGIDLVLWKRLINQVVKFRPEFNISMTEPLLYKDLIPLIEYITSRDLRCEVTTNGILLEDLAYDLVNTNLNRINISLDGPPKIHDQIRGLNGAFEKVMNGIKKLEKIKKSTNKTQPKVRIFYTISDYNYFCLAKTVNLLKERPIESITFQHLGFVTKQVSELHNRLHRNYPMSPSSISGVNPANIDIKILISEISQLKNSNNNIKIKWLPNIGIDKLEAYYNRPLEFVTKRRCMIPWINAQINSDGNVIPLTRCFNVVFGNIKSEDFVKIWNNKSYRNFRKDLRRIGVYPICSRCCALAMD